MKGYEDIAAVIDSTFDVERDVTLPMFGELTNLVLGTTSDTEAEELLDKDVLDNAAPDMVYIAALMKKFKNYIEGKSPEEQHIACMMFTNLLGSITNGFWIEPNDVKEAFDGIARRKAMGVLANILGLDTLEKIDAKIAELEKIEDSDNEELIQKLKDLREIIDDQEDDSSESTDTIVKGVPSFTKGEA